MDSTLYSRLTIGVALVIGLVGSCFGAAVSFLVIVSPGEDHDFDGPGPYIAGACFACGALLLAFVLRRIKNWLLRFPERTIA